MENNVRAPYKSVKSKLIQNQLTLAVAVLLLCAAAFIANDLLILKRSVQRSLHSNAQILKVGLAHAINAGDRKEAQRLLAGLKSEPSIVAATLTDRHQNVFASFDAPGHSDITAPAIARLTGDEVEGDAFIMIEPVGEGEGDAVLVIKADLRGFTQAYTSYLYIVLGMLVVGLLASYALAHLFQNTLSKPLIAFTETARAITNSGNYALRLDPDVSSGTILELSKLAEEFNSMLRQIEAQGEKLRTVNHELERKVDERTRELKDTQKLALEHAYEAGMSEIATGILHNIGNITNSVNTSAEEMGRMMQASKLGGLLKANAILKENFDRIPEFFATDSRAKILPDFYLKTGEILAAEQKGIQDELDGMMKKIALIKDVIHTQQDYAKKEAFLEKVSLADLTDEILALLRSSLTRHSVTVTKDFQCQPFVRVQRVKFAHILMNLFKNAKEAMKHLPIERELRVQIQQDSEMNVLLRVSDTGEGIKTEHLEKIFTHGFTTKKSGHGFGLHFCANAMKEMGGELRVESAGENRGSTFILVFPKMEAAARSA